MGTVLSGVRAAYLFRGSFDGCEVVVITLVTFMHTGRLWLLGLFVVLGLAYVILNYRTSSGSNSAVKSKIAKLLPSQSGLKRHLCVIVILAFLAALVTTWAQPLGTKQVPRERATVAVMIDISRSMSAQDVAPSRIEAAQDAAKEFVDSLPKTFNVSLILFAGHIELQTVPTTDRATIKAAIDAIELAPATAIGDGINSALDSLTYAPPDPNHPDEPAPGAIVLLSDGYTNVGTDSAQAAQTAKEQGVPIYTIAFGTPEGYVYEEQTRVPVPVNHAELSQIAKISGGKKYSAQSGSDLRQVYQTLARALGYDTQYVEVTDRYAGISVVVGLIAMLGVISLAARWP